MQKLKIIGMKIGIMSWKALLHLIIAEIIINLLWDWLSKRFELPVIREVGFLVLFVAVIFAVAWYLPKLSPVLGGAIKQRQDLKQPAWLGQVLKYDKENLWSLIYWEVDRWLFEHLNTPESYIEVSLQITNASVFSVIINGNKGLFNIEDNNCQLPPELPYFNRIPHGEKGHVQIKQAVSSETRDIMIEKYKKGEKVKIVFGYELNIEVEEPPIKIIKHVGDSYDVEITLK